MDARARAKFINSVAGGQNICCPQCKAINDPGSRFCFSCGSPLAQTFVQPVKEPEICCPKCKAVNDPGSKFCFSCGALIEQAAVPGEAAPKGKPIPKAESRAEMENVPGRDRVSETDHLPKIDNASRAGKASRVVHMPNAEGISKTQNIPIPAVEVNDEPESVFAEGLPSWSVEPPVIMVRRRRKK